MPSGSFPSVAGLLGAFAGISPSCGLSSGAASVSGSVVYTAITSALSCEAAFAILLTLV